MSNGMTQIKDINCPYNDIVHYKFGTNGIYTEEDCNNKCLKMDNCNATVNGGGYCWLKTKADNFKKQKGSTCSYKNNKIVTLQGLDSSGDDLKSFKNVTYDQCLSYCKNNPDCDTTAYAPTGKMCWIKNKYGKDMNYTVNSDRIITLLKPFSGAGGGSEQYEEGSEDYNKYQDALNSYQDAELVKTVMEKNKAVLGDMSADSTLKSNALEAHKQKLMREAQQQHTQQVASATSNDISKQLSTAYDQLIDENSNDINMLDNAIDNRHHLIQENNKDASEKNKSIYILSYFLLLLLLISVIILCTFLGIIDSKVALGLSVVPTILFILKVIQKYYWNNIDSETNSLKKIIYTGYKDTGENIRDAILPKWMYSCPKKCKTKKPDHMRPNPPRSNNFDTKDLDTNISENDWVDYLNTKT